MRLDKLIISIFMVLGLLITSTYAFSVEFISSDPAPIVAGDYADVTLRFTNSNVANDVTRKNVQFGIEKNDFILPVSANNEVISEVFNGESFTRTFRLFFSEDLEQGTVNIPVVITADSYTQKNDVSVFVEDSARGVELYIGQIRTTPDELLADTENNKVLVTLQNLGEKDAELLSVELIVNGDLIEPSFSYSMTDSVSKLEGGNEVDLEFTIDIEEEAKEVIPAKLKLNYRSERAVGNTYETFNEELDMNIILSDAPLLIVENVELLDEFKPGSIENRVRVTLRNDGLDDAREVRVRASPDISYPFIFELLTMYVTSEIEVGESSTVEFKVEVGSDAQAGDYTMAVVLESLVGETRYSREDEITLKVPESERASTSQIGKTIILIIIGVSIVIGFLTLRGRKKSKK